MPFKNMTPLLHVYDMKTSVAFYCDILDFKVAHAYKPDGHFYWASLERDGIKLMLNACYEDDKRPPEPDKNRINAHRDTELYFECNNIDAVYNAIKEKGIDLKPPSQSVYGAQEIKLKDPDGFRIIFFQETE